MLTPTETRLFNAESYLPSDLFTDSSSIPYLPENEYRQRIERIRGQLRAVEVAQQNLTLARQIYKTEGLGIEACNERLKNQIKVQDGQTIAVQLNQARTHTGIEQAKLTELKHDLQGYQVQAGLKAETWDLKLEGLKIDIEKAKHLLNEKRQELKTIAG